MPAELRIRTAVGIVISYTGFFQSVTYLVPYSKAVCQLLNGFSIFAVVFGCWTFADRFGSSGVPQTASHFPHFTITRAPPRSGWRLFDASQQLKYSHYYWNIPSVVRYNFPSFLIPARRLKVESDTDRQFADRGLTPASVIGRVSTISFIRKAGRDRLRPHRSSHKGHSGAELKGEQCPMHYTPAVPHPPFKPPTFDCTHSNGISHRWSFLRGTSRIAIHSTPETLHSPAPSPPPVSLFLTSEPLLSGSILSTAELLSPCVPPDHVT